jgi:TonB family protein
VKYLNLNISTPPPPPPPLDATGDMNVPPPPPPPPPLGIDLNGDGPPPLYVVDGSITSKAEVEKINPETIESVSVLKDKSATDKYGEKGNDGIVEINLKKTPQESGGKVTIKSVNSTDPKEPPLIVIDGVVSERTLMSDLNANSINSITVLKNEDAIKKYGEKGKNGAFEVKSRNIESHMKPAGSINISADSMIMYKDSVIIVHPKPYQNTDNNPFIVVEELPEFPGGKDAIAAWINANLKYPAEAVKAKITGKVYVNLMISKTGKVKNAVVSKSASPLLNAEAIRVISSMPDWKPGSQAGKLVDVQMQVPVEFKLN